MRYGPAIEASAEPGVAATYLDFIRAKIVAAPEQGIALDPEAISSVLHRHQPVLVKWMAEGGRRALFANFGLGKTLIQLELMRLLVGQSGTLADGRPSIALIVIPLTVRTEFERDAKLLGVEVLFVRRTIEIIEARQRGFTGLFLTNYESVREGKIDTSILAAVSLDEASCLRGFGGTKTFREFMRMFDGVRFKFVATATPSPNEYIELLAYAAFLEVMDVGQAKTRFFKRNSEKADELTIHPLPAKDVYRQFRAFCHATVYDHEHHVALTESLEAARSLPSGFALMPAPSWHPEVWSDVARMRTLNGEQAAKGREMHLCPLQFDIVDRLIRSDSNAGDLVYDPFGGLGTVPLRAVMLGRRGAMAELSPSYFADAVRILRNHDASRSNLTLFDLLAAEASAGPDDVDDADIPNDLEAAA